MPLDEGILLVLLHGLVRLLGFIFECLIELLSLSLMEFVFGYLGALTARILTLGRWRPESDTPSAVAFGIGIVVAVIVVSCQWG